MKVLVTGAAGFIGSHLVERLVADGREVIGIDNFDPLYDPAIKRRNVAGVLAGGGGAFRLVEADVRDAASLAPLASERLDALVHLAARAGARRSLSEAVEYVSTNVTGTWNVLDLARGAGARRFVLASSSSVYGDCRALPWREDAQVRPLSPYAATKLASEHLCRVFGGSGRRPGAAGMTVPVLRLFTVHGPRQRPDLAIHAFARRMLEGRPVTILGDGSSRRDYTCVSDVVDGIASALEADLPPFEVLNLGCGRPVPLLTVVRALEEELGLAASLEFRPAEPADVPETWADFSKAERLLGWRPRTGFREGLRAFVRWLREEGGAAGPGSSGRPLAVSG